MSFCRLLVSSSVFMLVACGGGDGSSPILTPGVLDTVPPTITFDPNAITVESGGMADVTLTATDNVSTTGAPTVDCTDGASFADNVFTAPTVTEETVVTCEATVMDAAGNTGADTLTATVTAPTTMTVTLVGSAFKGLILGGYVTVTDADDPTNTLAETRTSTEDGRFDIVLSDNADDPIDYFRIKVRGGPESLMICDAPRGCAGSAFGESFAIDDTVLMSGIFGAPEPGETLDASVTILSDLAATLVRAPVEAADLESAVARTKRVFGFDTIDASAVTPLDLTIAGAEGTRNQARLALISGGLLQSVLPDGEDAGTALATFRTQFSENDGELIAKETVDDPALISLEDIYRNSIELNDVIIGTATEITEALDDIEDTLTHIETEVIPDVLTSDGTLPVPDTTPPELTVASQTVTVQSGDFISVPVEISDDDPDAALSAASCGVGVYDIDAQIYTAPENLFTGVTDSCEIEAVDTAGNTGSTSFVVTVTPLQDDAPPVLTFTPGTASVQTGQSIPITLAATDNVGIVGGVDVSCTNGGQFEDDVFTAPVTDVAIDIVCTATATDAAGNSATAQLDVSVTPNPDITAPVVSEDTTSLCTATARDVAGNMSTAELTAQITFTPDTQDPVITINTPAPYSVVGESSIPFDFTVTDNVAVSEVVLSCDSNSLSLSEGRLHAAFTRETFTDRCRLIARDKSRNQTTEFFSVEIVRSANEPPILGFTPDAISLAPNGSGYSEISASDRHGNVVTGPDVSCSDGVTFANNVVTAPDVSTDIQAVCTAKATDHEGLSASAILTVDVKADAGPPVISGVVSFDRFGADTDTGAVDEDVLITHMARGITVEVLNAQDEVISTARTDAQGYYQAELQSFEEVSIRILTELQQDAAPDMPTTVQQRLNASPRVSGQTDPKFMTGLVTRQDIHFAASSDSLSVAAGLNALDVIYLGWQKVLSVDETIIFPKLDLALTETGNTLSERYGPIPKQQASH